MTTIEKYMAYDGTVFDDEAECCCYESKRYDTGSVRFLDEDMNELRFDGSWEGVFDNSKYLVCFKADAGGLFKFMYEYYGFVYPVDWKEHIGDVYGYDFDNGLWRNMSEEWRKMSKTLSDVSKAFWEEKDDER